MDRIILAVCFVITLVRASPSLLKLAGFGKINPQTGSISRPQILSPHENESKIQVIRQDPYVDEVPSCQMVIDCVEPLVISLSLLFQPAIDLRSAIDPCCCESHFEYRQLHLCLQRTSFFPPLFHQQSSVSDLLQEKLRIQLELCDVVSGVLLLEDVSLGWELASLLRAYLHEEGVQTLFTVGVRSASSPFDQALSTMAALRASSLFTSSGACSSLTACGIDSATATYSWLCI